MALWRVFRGVSVARPLWRTASSLAPRVLMVRPEHFGFNEQTAQDNEFQHKVKDDEKRGVLTRALAEFDGAVSKLRKAGIDVLVLQPQDDLPTPDEVFPNNWFATFPSGTVALFPMKCANRQREKQRYPALELLLLRSQLQINSVLHIGPQHSHDVACEGTGSLVLDHDNKVAYAALSVRTDPDLVEQSAASLGFREVVTFHTKSHTGREIYHTNVVMALLDGLSVVCAESVADKGERDRLLAALRGRGSVLEVSLEQAEKSFCANVLALRTASGSQAIVMSESAYRGFTPEQKEQLGRVGELVVVDIPTIEFVGGGSARCMMAEVFLPTASRKRRASGEANK